MIGTCSEGPIYRTRGSTTRLAAINGCHELARGKGFNPIARLEYFRGNLIWGTTLGEFRRLRINNLKLRNGQMLLGFEIFQTCVEDFFKTSSPI